MERQPPANQRRAIIGIIAAGVLVLSFALLAALINRQQLVNAGATVPECKNANALGGLPTSNRVGASYSGSPMATYVFDSFFNEGGGSGVPGLIAYCVYTSTDPTTGSSATTFTFDTDAGSGDFGFVRSGGDPTNIPLDGNSHTMGTATWSGSAPSGQIIVLHINFPDECHKLYGAGTDNTCFVLPGTKSTDPTPTPTNTPAGVPTPTNTPGGPTPTPSPTIIPTPTGTPHPK